MADLPPEKVRAIQTFYALYAAAIAVFWLALVVVYFTKSPYIPGRVDLFVIRLLTYINAGTAVLAAGAIVQGGLGRGTPPGPLPPGGFVRSPKSARFALIHGAGFIGMFTCMLAVERHVMVIQPLYWLNAASSLAVIVLVILTFPTAERLKAELDSYGAP